MPVWKFRDISEMPPLPLTPLEKRMSKLAALWEWAHLRKAPNIQRGVQRFEDVASSERARSEILPS